jgi:Ser/Thr protein kinase RdoA (MazF antagonist)
MAQDTAADMRAALETLQRQSHALLGAAGTPLRIVGRMSRPFSELARVHLDRGERPLSVYVKVTRPARDGAEERDRLARRVVNDYQVTKRLYESMPRDRGFSVVRPLACFPEHLALVTEEARGVTLLRLLESNAAWWPGREAMGRLERVFSRVGEWLSAFQRIPVEHADDHVTIERLPEYIDVRLTRLADHPGAGFSASDRRSVRDAIAARLRAVSPGEGAAVAIHGDVALGNILADGDDIVVLDLVMTTRGTRYHDLAQVYMQLELMTFKPQFRRSVIDRLQSALLEGYAAGTSPGGALFEVMRALHTTNHYLGLVVRPAGLAERLYNSRIERRHLSWLRQFAGTPVRHAVASAPGLA